LAYRAGALRDQVLELEGQPTPRSSAVELVRTTLIDRDEALQQVREDLERARSVAVDWEREVVSVRAECRRERAELEEVRSQRSQAEERAREAQQRAKEAEELKAALAAKAAAVVTAEEQLQQERAARQGVEGQLQQERAEGSDGD
jgi:predicted  nucleic acid-binding Zn-ribbon protein